MQVPGNLLYEIISERTGLDIDSEAGLMPCMIELAQMKRDYEKIKGALDQVEAVGYGIVMPTAGGTAVGGTRKLSNKATGMVFA